MYFNKHTLSFNPIVNAKFSTANLPKLRRRGRKTLYNVCRQVSEACKQFECAPCHAQQKINTFSATLLSGKGPKKTKRTITIVCNNAEIKNSMKLDVWET